MGCDLEMYTVKDGKLTIGMENDRSILAVEKMYRLLNETGAAWSISEGLSKLSPTFIEGHAMFMFNRLGQPAGDNFRAMEQQFGILPMPKLDEAQENYVSYPHDSGSVLSVPMNVDDKTFEMVGATMEALCGEAHRTYIDAFLETMLKSKYSRDALSGQCIDIVMSTLTKNTLMEYASYTANIVSACLNNPAKSNPSGFASAYASKLTAAQNAWDKAVADIVAANAK
ncbi:MAG: hypothetical protein E7662_12780 [Ruminococcaceae bacterium]|nr:hypothetical protein [Oscillospiraceae bacterium]